MNKENNSAIEITVILPTCNEKGKVKIDLYNEKLKRIKTVVITQGDTILLANGAHAIEILEDSRIIEVKQGPYAGVDDKEYI